MACKTIKQLMKAFWKITVDVQYSFYHGINIKQYNLNLHSG